MLDADPDRRARLVASLLTLAQRLAAPALAMDPALQALLLQRRLDLRRTIGAVRPHIGARVIRRQDLAEYPAIAVGRRRHGAFADKAVTTVDDNMRLVAERRDRDHRQRRSVGSVTDLAANLQSPAFARQWFASKP